MRNFAVLPCVLLRLTRWASLLFAAVISQQAMAGDLESVAFNSMLDAFQADGIPDEVRPHARDYVAREATLGRNTAFIQETRTFIEFPLAGQTAAHRVTLVFKVGRYNTPHVFPQEVYVAYYSGNGTIELDDWSRPATDLGKTALIAAFDPDGKNRGQSVPMSMDVTGLFNGAVQERMSHLGFSFRKQTTTVIDPRDRLGYSSLNTLQSCVLRIEHKAPRTASKDTVGRNKR